jgi:hypothetical protein
VLAADDRSLAGAIVLSAGFTLPGAPGNEEDGLAAAPVSSTFWDAAIAPLAPDAAELLPAELGGTLACSPAGLSLSLFWSSLF